jgi:hypothetical protein
VKKTKGSVDEYRQGVIKSLMLTRTLNISMFLNILLSEETTSIR